MRDIDGNVRLNRAVEFYHFVWQPRDMDRSEVLTTAERAISPEAEVLIFLMWEETSKSLRIPLNGDCAVLAQEVY